MKYNYLAIAAIAFSLFSCGGEKPAETTETSTPSASEEYTLIADSSKVMWEGNMTGIKTYSHTGTLNFTEGKVTVENGKVVGGSFTVDVKSMAATDANYTEEKGHTAADLIAHLSNGDFFLVDSFPTASLVITGVAENGLTADLTIRGKSNPETITDVVVTPSADGSMLTTTGKLTFDRQKYGAAFSMEKAYGMKDLLIADDIKLDIKIVSKK